MAARLTAAGLDRLHAAAARHVGDDLVPGLVALVACGDQVHVATGYQPTPAGLVVSDPPDGAWSKPPAFGDGAAGLVSTVDDLLAFARMLLRGGAPVLSAEAARAMTTDQLTAEQKARSGLGPDFFAHQSWSYCQSVLDNGGFGWNGGLGTSWLVDPNSDLTVI